MLRVNRSQAISTSVTSRWYSVKRLTSSSLGPYPVRAGDFEILGEFRDHRDCLHARPFEQRDGGRVALEAGGQPIQTLGDLLQHLRRRLQRARVRVDHGDADPLQGGAGLLAFFRGIVGGLRQSAHHALEDRDVLVRPRARQSRTARLPWRSSPVRSSTSLMRTPYSPRLLAASNPASAMLPRTAAPAGDRSAPRSHGGEQAADRALRALQRVLDELLDLLAEAFELRFRIDLLLLRDHLLVGLGDRVDGLRLRGCTAGEVGHAAR